MLLPKYRPEPAGPSPVDRAIEASEAEPVTANPHALPLDKDRARGVPIVGQVSGGAAIRDTQPLGALMRKLRP